MVRQVYLHDQEYCISNTTSQVIRSSRSAVRTARLSKRLNRRFLGTKRARRRTIRYSLLTGNLAILVAVGVLITGAAQPSNASTDRLAAASNSFGGDVAGPLDQVSSVDIAVAIAQTTGLTESVAVANQSDSVKTMTAITPADTAVVTKPQVVATNAKTGKDITKYVVVEGDTLPSVAAKFNVTSDSIRWSNDTLRGDNLRPGTELIIPPVTGIVYTVLIGDTPDSIAQKFRANKDQLIAFNDAEVSGFATGQRIVVPNGQKAAAAGLGSGVVAGVAGGGAFSARYGYNGYDPGWCTWYAASRVSVPTNWGNASTWDDRARLSGWTVSQVPVPGAIAQRNGGWGHVGIVEDVKQEGGVWYIKYSDMNGLAGFNRVGYSGWVPALGKYQNFIYR